MNDAYRGALIVGATLALCMAFLLAVESIVRWKRAARRHVGHHVVIMTVALGVTVSLIVAGAVADAGTNRQLAWWDIARGVQVALIIAGLRPLWVHAHRKREPAP